MKDDLCVFTSIHLIVNGKYWSEKGVRRSIYGNIRVSRRKYNVWCHRVPCSGRRHWELHGEKVNWKRENRITCAYFWLKISGGSRKSWRLTDWNRKVQMRLSRKYLRRWCSANVNPFPTAMVFSFREKKIVANKVSGNCGQLQVVKQGLYWKRAWGEWSVGVCTCRPKYKMIKSLKIVPKSEFVPSCLSEGLGYPQARRVGRFTPSPDMNSSGA